MDEKKSEKEELKAKKIRRILLLKIDRELKSDTNKNINIMINSKKIQDLNKAYNSYKILLSETTRIYSNYVEFIEKSFPINKKEIKKKRVYSPRRKKEEKSIKSLNTSFDSNIPVFEYIPNKIDLGKKKITNGKRIAIKNWNSPQLSEEKKNIRENNGDDEILHKSTKINKKGITKVIDKIVKIKLNTDIEDDYNITKSIIKLRKYCFKLIKKKKKPKKGPNLRATFSPKKPPTSPRKPFKDKGGKRTKYHKRKTIIGTHPFIQMSLLGIKESNKEEKVARKETYKKVTKFLNSNINEKNNEVEKTKFFSKSIKTNKLSSLKEIKIIKDNEKENEKEKEKEKLYSDRKRKLRRVQTMNMKNIQTNLIKLSEKKKFDGRRNASTLNQFNFIKNEPLVSTKFVRPPKFIIINNNNIILKKKNSLIDNKSLRLKKEKYQVKNNEEKKEELQKKRNKPRKSFMRNYKNTVKLGNSSSKKFKIFSDS